jgi:hypothetical protein
MLLQFFESCEASLIGRTIRDSLWLFPAIETVHLLALALIGGAVLIVDLHLLGLGLQRLSLSEVAREAYPWFIGSLSVIILSGVLLFLSEATKCYYNPAFWTKMTFLVAALFFSLNWLSPRALAALVAPSRTRLRILAAVSILLWSGVGLGGRFIGFY